MSRNIFAAIILSAVLAVVVWAQQIADQVLGTETVAYAAVQNSQTVPQAPRNAPSPDPKPETQPQQNPTPNASESSASEPSSIPSTTAQSFTGSIAKEGDSYVLKVSDTTSYKLDDQPRAKSFAGQHVRVTGKLESDTSLIHVQSIAPLS